MKKIFIPLLMMLCTIFSATKVQAADLFTGRPVIGVWEFENKAAISKELFEISNNSVDKTHSWISDFIEIVLTRTNETKDRFEVVNYKRQKKLVEDRIWRKNNGLVDTNDEDEPLLLSVDIFIDGSLTGISTKPTTVADIDHALLGKIDIEKRTVIANVMFNFTDKRGRIITGFDGEGKSSVAKAVLTINEKGEEVYETDNTDSGTKNPAPSEGKTTNILKHTIEIGTETYSLVQVQNAVRKAIIDAVQNKKYGLVAVLNGTAKKGGKFYK